MMQSDVRQILILSAQADHLATLRKRKRISEEEYLGRLAALRQQCAFQAVELNGTAANSAASRK